jgi:hypothetical protein
MPTPDGISDADWEVVRDLAADVVNNSEDEPTAAGLRQRLLYHLASFEAKYGVLPSILATRADYIAEDDLEGRLALLLRAHSLAATRGDYRNLLYTASSLASLYLETLRDAQRGREWLQSARGLLTLLEDKSEIDELARLEVVLRRLEDGLIN